MNPTFQTQRRVELDQARRYAEASGDINPIHLDEKFARSVGLNGCILHGLCSMAFVAQAAAEWCGDPRFLKRLKLRFSQPVYMGDELTLTGEILDESPSHTRCKIRMVNQKGEDVISGAQGELAKSLDAGASTLSPLKLSTPALPIEKYVIAPEAIEKYALAIGDPNPLYRGANAIAPPMFAAVFGMKPLIKAFQARLTEKFDVKIIHGGQEMEFQRPLHAGEHLAITAGIERSSQKGGMEFTYFVTEARDENQLPVVFSRSLAVIQDGATKSS